MKKLDETVKQYLIIETNHALMITGEWGIGKTYYYINILEGIIRNTFTIDNASQKYRPILVSLFGENSIESIQAKVLITLFSFGNNKKVKVTLELVKLLAKGFMAAKGLGSSTKLIDEIEVSAKKVSKDLIDYKNIVICFDDLDRVSPKLDIQEFIGFVNTLVEHEGVKVLILANENQIDKDKFSMTNLITKILPNLVIRSV